MMPKKAKLILLISGVGLTSTAALSTIVYTTTPEQKKFKFVIDNNAKPNIQNEDVDLSKSKVSAFDYNLPKKEKKIVQPDPKPIVEPPKVLVDPIIKNPEKPKPQPIPEPEPIPEPKPQPVPEPQPVPIIPPKDEPKKPLKIKKKIKHGDIEFEADLEVIPDREYDVSDIDKGITNRIPYIAEVTPDVTNVSNGASAANIKKTLGRATTKAKEIGAHFNNDYGYGAALSNDNKTIEEKQAYINADGNAPDHFGNLW
ncbi:Uncharacterised protein, partial [Mycoplasmopsis edwardii]